MYHDVFAVIDTYGCRNDNWILPASTIEQLAGFEAQKRNLEKSGCAKLFSEQVGSIAERAQLEAAIDFAREGVVCPLKSDPP